MEALITRLTSQLGIEASVAQKAIGVIFGFLENSGPEDKVNQLMDQLPGVRDAMAVAPGGDDGIMGSLGKLQGLGLDMGQAKTIATETMNFAREHADGDLVDQIKDQIPGLNAIL